MAVKPSELWMSHYSVASWGAPVTWNLYFKQAAEILEDTVDKLDENDPIRRKMTHPEEIGSFITNFHKAEYSRSIQGKFKKSGISFQIQQHRNGLDSFGRLRINKCALYIPGKFAVPIQNIKKIEALFDLGNSNLEAFYGWCDTAESQIGKRAPYPRRTVNLSEELLGMFWLTYFGKAYVEFFGMDRLLLLPLSLRETLAGVTLQAAAAPHLVSTAMRVNLEELLGKETFAGTTDEPKPLGRHALSIEELRGKVT